MNNTSFEIFPQSNTDSINFISISVLLSIFRFMYILLYVSNLNGKLQIRRIMTRRRSYLCSFVLINAIIQEYTCLYAKLTCEYLIRLHEKSEF